MGLFRVLRVFLAPRRAGEGLSTGPLWIPPRTPQGGGWIARGTYGVVGAEARVWERGDVRVLSSVSPTTRNWWCWHVSVSCRDRDPDAADLAQVLTDFDLRDAKVFTGRKEAGPGGAAGVVYHFHLAVPRG